MLCAGVHELSFGYTARSGRVARSLMALASGSGIAYLAMYLATGGGPTPAVARANGVSERTRAAAMVGLVGASVSMVCLRMQWWLPLIPGLVLTIVGWAATIVFWLKDS